MDWPLDGTRLSLEVDRNLFRRALSRELCGLIGAALEKLVDMALHDRRFTVKEFRVETAETEIWIKDLGPGSQNFLTVEDLSKIVKRVAELVWFFDYLAANFTIVEDLQRGRRVGTGFYGKKSGLRLPEGDRVS